MRRLLLIIPAILIVAIIAVITIALLIPKSVYKEQVQTAAENALGRTVNLDGPVGLSFFPRIAASIEDVTIANPEGFEDTNMVEAGKLKASVKWGPLLTGRVSVHEIALVDADIRLQRLADGQANWEFGSETQAPAETGEPEAPTQELNAGLDKARVVNTSVTYSDAVSGQAFALTEFNAEGSVRSLTEPLVFEGSGLFDGDTFSVDLVLDSPSALLAGSSANADLTLKTDFADIRFDGAALMGDAPSMEGTFAVAVPSIAALASNAGISAETLPIALDPLGAAEAKGSIGGALDALQLTFEQASIDGAALDINYSGDVSLAGTPRLNSGQLSVSLSDAAATIQSLGLDIAQAAALRGADLSIETGIDGPVDALSFTNTDFTLNGPLLIAGFAGDLSLADTGSIGGTLNASSDDLRGLMSAIGIELEPGTTLQTFRISGQTNGTPNRISVTDLDLALDDVTGSGNLAFDMTGVRPKLTGALATGALDFTPFLGPAPEAEQPAGWSKTPLALDSLKTIDADIALTSPSLTIDKLVLRDADIKATLNNGDLDATINQLSVFGGTWGGSLGLDASRSTPTLAMVLTGNSILMEDLMQTLAGSNRIAGTGQFALDVTSIGVSIHDIMNGLNGTLSTNLADGALRGVNLGQLFRAKDSLQQSLSGGGLNLGLSATDQTDFASFDTVLNIQNGVAQIGVMELINSALSANGNGTINLGAQTLDMGLKFAADTSGRGNLSDVQLNGTAIPLRITGPWTSPSVVPDTAALTQALAGEQIGRLQETVSDQIGGALGDEVGNALGGILGNQRGGDAPADDSDTADEDEEEEDPTAEEVVEDLARDALGGLFGRGD